MLFRIAYVIGCDVIDLIFVVHAMPHIYILALNLQSDIYIYTLENYSIDTLKFARNFYNGLQNRQ